MCILTFCLLRNGIVGVSGAVVNIIFFVPTYLVVEKPAESQILFLVMFNYLDIAQIELLYAMTVAAVGDSVLL